MRPKVTIDHLLDLPRLLLNKLESYRLNKNAQDNLSKERRKNLA